ncbi:hypothetical protein HanRHA438_Chr14g0666751 [Helianthus annuus]|nr:hypothetical protein HanRHA438_Chr14g0666751 [Helianthus annuus]
MATVWRIWLARNSNVSEGNFTPTRKAIEMIKEDAFLWISIRSKLPTPKSEKWLDFDLIDLL